MSAVEGARGGTLLIVGPTASGKSRMAMELAAASGAEIISADSMQVYRGMDVGTAKASAEERARVPHHCLDLVDPHAGDFTLADWLAHAIAARREIHARGKAAIVVGGTNLYVKALLDGTFSGPAPDPALRTELAALPQEAARAELARVDPEASERIHRNDRRRTLRALEVFRQTGIPISRLQEQWRDSPQPLPARTAMIGLRWSPPELNRRINARVGAMIRDGLVAEVRRLLAGGALNRQAVEAVGYREIIDHLEGRATLDDSVEAIKIRSRQLAKTQRTWLRRFATIPGSEWFDGNLPAEELVARGAAVLAALMG